MSGPKLTMPSRRLVDGTTPATRRPYVKSEATDLRETFAKVRQQMAQAEVQSWQLNVQPMKRRAK